jgi:hypothetical protein
MACACDAAALVAVAAGVAVAAAAAAGAAAAAAAAGAPAPLLLLDAAPAAAGAGAAAAAASVVLPLSAEAAAATSAVGPAPASGGGAAAADAAAGAAAADDDATLPCRLRRPPASLELLLGAATAVGAAVGTAAAAATGSAAAGTTAPAAPPAAADAAVVAAAEAAPLPPSPSPTAATCAVCRRVPGRMAARGATLRAGRRAHPPPGMAPRQGERCGRTTVFVGGCRRFFVRPRRADIKIVEHTGGPNLRAGTGCRVECQRSGTAWARCGPVGGACKRGVPVLPRVGSSGCCNVVGRGPRLESPVEHAEELPRPAFAAGRRCVSLRVCKTLAVTAGPAHRNAHTQQSSAQGLSGAWGTVLTLYRRPRVPGWRCRSLWCVRCWCAGRPADRPTSAVAAVVAAAVGGPGPPACPQAPSAEVGRKRSGCGGRAGGKGRGRIRVISRCVRVGVWAARVKLLQALLLLCVCVVRVRVQALSVRERVGGAVHRRITRARPAGRRA